jgi:cytochrome c-type biogenesis protein CcmF
VLTSVHAFASDPARGVFILGFIAVVVVGSLAALARQAAAPRRAAAPRPGGCVAATAIPVTVPGAPAGGFSALARESLLLANTLLLLVVCASVLLGTLYPMIVEALGIGRISVGPPYFETVLLPVVLPLALLAGLGPLAGWRVQPPSPLARRALAPALAAAACVAAVLAWSHWAGDEQAAGMVAGARAGAGAPAPAAEAWRWSAPALLGLFAAGWIAAATLQALRQRLRRTRGEAGTTTSYRLPVRFLAMVFAHIGLAVLVAGITVVKARGVELDLRLAAGERAGIGAYAVRLARVGEVAGPNYAALRADVEVFRGDVLVATLHPEKRTYHAQPGTPMTEAAIESGLFGDLYVALGEPVAAGAWTMRVQLKPLVGWIWGGCALMAIGGLLAGVARGGRSPRAAAPQQIASD